MKTQVELVRGEVLELPPNALIVLPAGTEEDVVRQLLDVLVKQFGRKDFVVYCGDIEIRQTVAADK